MAKRRPTAPRRHQRSSRPAAIGRASDVKTCFLDLPVEIRNSVYTLALVNDKDPNGYDPEITYTRRWIPEPALLRACRQIRDEALPVFYGANIFQCLSTHNAIQFLRGLTPKKLAALRTVHCTLSSGNLSANYFANLKSQMQNIVGIFRGSSLRYDAIQVAILVAGEDHCRFVLCHELEDYEVRIVGCRDMLVQK
ncbi:hypothetical protein M409DRAFT_24769 [Zasmidium cellare ATCC 36951]|uniref:Uncharacterized protein n=1 Tax=Zasmidium cellare ATCC 36951 TaxID=1080233 RepID=A0A6A6CCE9_ZASCE|nr:uncharacterized protein M409DRAFT_24769 [Zasmidium cellare ATCC 36951]KAF2164864.1 hypothetical protein M409DRAFT_24769 [Zasmidium cellare ATCC 36951]